MKDTIFKAVASLIANSNSKVGVANYVVAQAGRGYGIAGTTRLRELGKIFRCIDGQATIPYFYRSGRYYPSAPFKRFCAKRSRDN